jgi:fermentation-respiration switch protein FrsA (DUF1100 family)
MYLLKYDPEPVLEQIKIPVLALNGTLDIQVRFDVNLKKIDNALKKAGNTNYSLRVFEGLNHFFQNAETGYIDEYSRIDETISTDVLKYISSWINSL